MSKLEQRVLLAAVMTGVLAGAGLSATNVDRPVHSEKYTAGPIDRNKCNGSCGGKCHSVLAVRKV